jgi:hypothetical protein
MLHLSLKNMEMKPDIQRKFNELNCCVWPSILCQIWVDMSLYFKPLYFPLIFKLVFSIDVFVIFFVGTNMIISMYTSQILNEVLNEVQHFWVAFHYEIEYFERNFILKHLKNNKGIMETLYLIAFLWQGITHMLHILIF